MFYWYRKKEPLYTVKLVDELILLINVPNKIVIVKSLNQKINERLIKRGHKRFNKIFDINQFIENGTVLINKIETNTNFEIISVHNETQIDMSKFYKDIGKLQCC